MDYMSYKNNDEFNNKKASIIQNAVRNRLARKEFKSIKDLNDNASILHNAVRNRLARKEKTIKDLNDTIQEKLQKKFNPETRDISTQAGNTISTSEVWTEPRGRGRPSNRERVLYADPLNLNLEPL